MAEEVGGRATSKLAEEVDGILPICGGRHGDVRCNVDAMKILQVGISFFDGDGSRWRTWDIHFRDFDVSSPSDAQLEPSVQLLKSEDEHNRLRENEKRWRGLGRSLRPSPTV